MSVIHLAHAVVKFYEGARIRSIGALLSNNDTISAGLKNVREALAVIDHTGESGRDILIPFLTNTNPMVRLESAQALYATHRELAVPVLLDLDLSCVTEANHWAALFLMLKGEPNSMSKRMSQFYPHRYDDTLYKEALERFDRMDLP